MHKKVTETHPQSGPVKRLSLAGAKPLKLTTITTLAAVFPKAQNSQSRAKMEAKMRSAGTQNHEQSSKRAPQKTLTKKTTKRLDRVPIWMLKTEYFFAAFWCLFRALGRPGAKLVPEPPPRAPGMVPDPILNDFCWFLNGFWMFFAFVHLSAITFFCNCFGISFWLLLSSSTCLPPPK